MQFISENVKLITGNCQGLLHRYEPAAVGTLLRVPGSSATASSRVAVASGNNQINEEIQRRRPNLMLKQHENKGRYRRTAEN